MNCELRKVAMIKELQYGEFSFLFHGATTKVIKDTFDSLKYVCDSKVKTESVHGMTNGKCHSIIVVKITGIHTIRDEELSRMVVHFLRKKGCDVEEFNDFQKFLNA